MSWSAGGYGRRWWSLEGYGQDSAFRLALEERGIAYVVGVRSTLPAGMALRELVRLDKIRWRIEHDYRELETGLGLGYFEGRTYQGFLRHVTLVSVAYAFCTLLRLDPKALAAA